MIIIRQCIFIVNNYIIKNMYDADKILKQFGRNVKAERIRLGFSQETLAEKMNVNPQYLSKIECGKQNMSIKKIIELTNFLSADLKDIFRF